MSYTFDFPQGTQPGIRPQINVHGVHGDLQVRGWEAPAISAKGDAPQVEPLGEDGVQITSQGDLSLRVPQDADLTVDNVSGSARVIGLYHKVTLGNISGDLELRKIGTGSVENISGDLRLKRVEDGITIGSISGDASIRDVDGDTALGRVSGDLYVRSINGGCTAPYVSGDLVLSTDFLPDAPYAFRVSGDIICRVPEGANVTFYVPAGSDLTVDAASAEVMPASIPPVPPIPEIPPEPPVGIPGFPPEDLPGYPPGPPFDGIEFWGDAAITEEEASPEEPMPEEEIAFERKAKPDGDWQAVIFGNGDAVVILEASGEIRLVGEDEDYMMAINFQIEGELAERLAGLEQRIASQLEGLDEVIAKKTEKMRARAEKEAERAARRAERVARKAQRKARRVSVQFGGEPRPAKPVEPVSDEERLMILKMVEAQQISVEEAERLLAALEGK